MMGLLFTTTISASGMDETIHINTPGTLQEMLVDLDTRPTKLTITGMLNATDLNYLNSCTGKIASVTDLDLSEVELLCDSSLYQQITVGNVTIYVFLSDECKADTVEASKDPLGSGVGSSTSHYVVRHYTNQLGYAFYNNTVFKRVVLPKRQTKVDACTFQGSAVETVILPNGVEEIGDYAFYDSQLTTLKLPENVKHIGKHAFAGNLESCLPITTLTLPAACTSIGEGAFHRSLIGQINLEHVIKMGAYAFYSSAITKANLQSLTSIPDEAFCKCEQLTSVKCSSNLRSVGNSAFKYSRKLTSIDLGKQIESIGDNAFWGLSKLERITIPNTITYVGYEAFYDCKWLKNISPIGGIYYIGNVAYAAAEKAGSPITLSFREGTVSISSTFSSRDNQHFKDNLKNIVFPASLRRIAGFRNCPMLERITLPEGVEQIDDQAFSDCPKLDLDVLPTSLVSIGKEAFANCPSIGQLTLGENLQYIGNWAFSKCSGLYDIRLNARRVMCDDYSSWFSGCSVEKITIGASVERVPNRFAYDLKNSLLRLKFDDRTSPLEIGDYAFYECGINFILPQNISKIGDAAFSGCKKAVFSLSEGLIEVGERAFLDCTFDADTLILPQSLTNIAPYAFEGTQGYSHLIMPVTLQTIGALAFENASMSSIDFNCANLTITPGEDSQFGISGNTYRLFKSDALQTVNIGTAVTCIPAQAFPFCYNLRSIHFKTRNDTTRSTTVDLTIGDRAFEGCSSIDTLQLPDYITTIGNKAFYGCEGLKSLRLGNRLRSIGDNAFSSYSYLSGRNKLSTIDIPSSVTIIGKEAFRYQCGISDVYMHKAEVPVIGDNAFTSSATIHVPIEAESVYRSALYDNTVEPYGDMMLTLNHNTLDLNIGDESTLYAEVNPYAFRGLNLSWTSSDENVATVDDYGNVTGVGAGNATIAVTTTYVNGNSASCNITIKDGTSVNDIFSDASSTPIGYYDLNGRAINKVQRGVNIIRMKDGTIQKMVVR